MPPARWWRATHRDGAGAVGGGVRRVRADADLLETGTESEWVAQALEAAGHEVVVADPNFAPMYGEHTARSKRIDEMWRRWPKPIGAGGIGRRIASPRRSAPSARCCGCGACWSSSGPARLRYCDRCCARRLSNCLTGASRNAPAQLARLVLPAAVAQTLAPLRRLIETLTTEIATVDQVLRARTDGDRPTLAKRAGRRPIVAITFRATLDDIETVCPCGPGQRTTRTRAARGQLGRTTASRAHHENGAACSSSACWCKRAELLAEQAQRGLTRAGRAARSRRGKRVAVVALARRLSRILYALWRDASVFDGRNWPPPNGAAGDWRSHGRWCERVRHPRSHRGSSERLAPHHRCE